MSIKLFQQIFRHGEYKINLKKLKKKNIRRSLIVFILVSFVGYVRPSAFAYRVANYSDAPASDSDPDQPISIENPFKRDERVCLLCEHNIFPDYKNVQMLSQFQSSFTGRIYGRHITGLCAQKQELVEKEIKKAQRAGLMPIYLKSPEYFEDPKLFNPDRPLRPHRF